MLSSPLFPTAVAAVVVMWDGGIGERCGGCWGGGKPDQVTAAIMRAFATHGAPERARHAGLDTEYPPR